MKYKGSYFRLREVPSLFLEWLSDKVVAAVHDWQDRNARRP